MGTVHVEESGLNDLKAAMAEAGENYKQNLAKLQNLINENTIDQAEEDMGMQTTKFTSMISNLSSSMQ